jgi:hypothetical protein
MKKLLVTVGLLAAHYALIYWALPVVQAKIEALDLDEAWDVFDAEVD